MNYQQDDWIEWLVAVRFQYNDKRHTATGRILFELNFGQYLWKDNLTVKTELPKLEDFLNKLQGSWKKAKKLMEIEKEAMKRQFDKKKESARIEGRRQCMVGSKKYSFEQTLKEAGSKKI